MTDGNAVRKSLSIQSASTETPVAVAWWVWAIAILIALLTATGAVIALVNPAMLVSPHDAINGAARIYAGYLVSRNAAIAIALAVLIVTKSKRALGNLLALAGLIQLLDAIVDCTEARWTIAPGVFVLGVLCLIAAAQLRRGPQLRTEN